jgi:hypothetical protein
VNHPLSTKPSPLPPSIIDLIDDALNVVSSQQAKRLLNLLDETHRLLLETQAHPQRPAIDALRAAAQQLSEASGYLGFNAGLDFAYAAESLTSRLLVNARCSPAEWRRVLAMEEHCFALLGPRRWPATTR